MQEQTPSVDESALEARALALFPHVLERIDRRRQRRTRLRWTGVAGMAVALVMSGALLGAALVSPPVFNPGQGELYTSQGKFQPASFAIDCETSTDVRSASGYSLQYDSQADINAAIRNFASTCYRIIQQAEIDNAVGQAIRAQAAKGIHCGIIHVAGGHNNYWNLNGESPRDGSTFSDSPQAYGPGCDSVVTISMPHVFVGPVAACAEASNWVLVFERHGLTAAEVCKTAGFPIWGQ